MRDRCDLHPRECSCMSTGIPCRTQPEPIDIIEDANTSMASFGPLCLSVLFAIVWALTFYAATVFDTTGI